MPKAFLLFVLMFSLLLGNPSRADIDIFHGGTVAQGHSLAVMIPYTLEIEEASVEFKGKRYPFFRSEAGFRAFLPTRPEAKPGTYPLNVTAVLGDGSVLSADSAVSVKPFDYSTVSFTVKPSKKKLLGPDIMTVEWQEIEGRLLDVTSEKLWEGSFIKPVPGITTMGYGVKEVINGKLRGRHRGWDFRAAVGTKVRAPNHGVAKLVRPYRAFGGTMVINHGQGVDTLYFHLSKMLVKEGDLVRKGDVIALTGNTGFSSGPHLHWGMSVNNVRVDPRQWVTTVIP